ncbi:hypothetical protein, partial [Xanthomonas oryzae]|uniref:hypothetical protein n=1 Tax=Xanthomonas oryzae TaxID=347 RepID=UPI0012B218B1
MNHLISQGIQVDWEVEAVEEYYFYYIEQVLTESGTDVLLRLHDPATGLSHPLVAYRYVEGDLVAAEDALGAARRFVYRQHR